MRLLKDLAFLPEGTHLDALPEDIMNEIQKNIRAGAKDLEQKWANALELVHKAYEVAAVQRPMPDMKNAWKQYEENLQYAVQQLAKSRGMKGDWRMSSHIFHEALEKRIQFKVRMSTPTDSVSYTTEARSMSELIDIIKESDPGEYDMKVKRTPDNMAASLHFSRYGVKVKYRVDIEQVGVVGAVA